MGLWGYTPLCNDTALDILGGYSNKSGLMKKIDNALKSQRIYGAYEVVAIVCDSFGVTNYTHTFGGTDYISIIENSVRNNMVDDDIIDRIQEVAWMELSVCTLSLDERLNILSITVPLLTTLLSKSKVQKEYINNIKEVYEKAIEVGKGIKSGTVQPINLEERTLRLFYNLVQQHEAEKYAAKFDNNSLVYLHTAHGEDGKVVHILKSKKHGIMNVYEANLRALQKAGKIKNGRDVAEDNKGINALEIKIKRIHKKGGKPLYYDITDNTGKTITVEVSDLKNAIRDNKVIVSNYKLTSDNKLMPVKHTSSR